MGVDVIALLHLLRLSAKIFAPSLRSAQQTRCGLSEDCCMGSDSKCPLTDLLGVAVASNTNHLA